MNPGPCSRSRLPAETRPAARSSFLTRRADATSIPAKMRRQIYLVPGFFGYSQLGGLNYFMRVAEVLEAALKARGISAEVYEVPTQPTGSIPRRALFLMDAIEARGGLDADEIHLVGHSTGGLDIRLLATPGVRVRKDGVGARIADKVRSVITMATPHFGTPLATIFTTVPGRNLLQLMASLALSKSGRLGIFFGSKLATAVARFDDRFGLKNTPLDYAVAKMLQFVTQNPDDPIWGFLRNISKDQGAIIQLTPEGTDLFNAAVTDRPGIDYRSIITAAPPMSLSKLGNLIVRDRSPTPLLFRLLYGLAADEHDAYPYPQPSDSFANHFAESLSFTVDHRSNDGVVPTLSQMHGQPLLTVVADHLDVVGQFRNAGGDRYADWLPSGSAFSEEVFQQVYDAVADQVGRHLRVV